MKKYPKAETNKNNGEKQIRELIYPLQSCLVALSLNSRIISKEADVG
jgi:hypothetical protein